MINIVAAVLLAVALAAAVLFIWTYARGSSWRTSPLGPTIMLTWVGLAFLLAANLVLNTIGQGLARDVLRLIADSLLAVALWRQLLLLRTIQRRSLRVRFSKASDNSNAF